MDELKRMCTPQMTLYLIIAVWLLWTAITYLRQKHRLLSLLLGAGSGVGGLLLCHYYGDAFGFQPPLTACTLLVGGVGGIPALLLLYGLQFLMVTK